MQRQELLEEKRDSSSSSSLTVPANAQILSSQGLFSQNIEDLSPANLYAKLKTESSEYCRSVITKNDTARAKLQQNNFLIPLCCNDHPSLGARILSDRDMQYHSCYVNRLKLLPLETNPQGLIVEKYSLALLKKDDAIHAYFIDEDNFKEKLKGPIILNLSPEQRQKLPFPSADQNAILIEGFNMKRLFDKIVILCRYPLFSAEQFREIRKNLDHLSSKQLFEIGCQEPKFIRFIMYDDVFRDRLAYNPRKLRELDLQSKDGQDAEYNERKRIYSGSYLHSFLSFHHTGLRAELFFPDRPRSERDKELRACFSKEQTDDLESLAGMSASCGNGIM